MYSKCAAVASANVNWIMFSLPDRNALRPHANYEWIIVRTLCKWLVEISPELAHVESDLNDVSWERNVVWNDEISLSTTELYTWLHLHVYLPFFAGIKLTATLVGSRILMSLTNVGDGVLHRIVANAYALNWSRQSHLRKQWIFRMFIGSFY